MRAQDYFFGYFSHLVVVANVPLVRLGMFDVAKVVARLDTPALMLDHTIETIPALVKAVGLQGFLQIGREGNLVGQLLVQVVEPFQV